MTTYGVTPQGFVPKTVQTLVSDINAAMLANVDPQLDLSAEEPLGQIIGIFAEKLAELWELGGTAYNSCNRDAAEGPQLDNIGGLTGTKRQTQKPSFTMQTCVFSQAGTFSVGALVANVNGQSSVQFANANNLSVALVNTTYTVTDTDTNTVLGTSASLPVTGTNIKFLCTQDGPIQAPAGQLTVITNPVTGWQSTTNPLDATVGANVELDTPYRLRQDAEISAVGSGNPDAIRADLLNVTGVIQAFVLENNADTYDQYNNPPHSFQAVIWDGSTPQASNNAIAQTIWNDKPSGIQVVGNTTGSATDSNGNTQVMPFSRATQDLLYLEYTVTMLPGQQLTAASALTMKEAIVAATQAQYMIVSGVSCPNPAYLSLGTEVYAEAMKSALMNAGLGVQNISQLLLGFAPNPVGTVDLPVGALAIALADTSRITINGF